jgi:TonB family protein
MSARLGLVSLAVAAAAVPAEAAQGPEPWARVGEWQVRPDYPGRCSAMRQYPGGTRIFVSSHRDGSAGLLVGNRAWSRRNPGTHRLALIQGGAPRGLAAQVEEGFIGLNLSARAGSGLLAQLAGGGSLEVAAPDGTVLQRLDLGGVAPALERLGPCISEAAIAENFPPVAAPPPRPPPPSGRRGKEHPARARVSLPMLFSSEDYPVAAVRAGEEGPVAFRLEVGTDGRVAVCTVTGTSGSASLDAATCRLLRSRARFTPASNRKGKPIEDSVSGRIIWQLPEPEPEPEPPPPASP